MPTLGIDIGGANLKFADSLGHAHSVYFPMWTRWKSLSQELATHAGAFAGIERIAITMTGEMADCFATRRDGVAFIVDSVNNAFPDLPLSFFQVDGLWCGAQTAINDPWSVAASNWRAIADYLAANIDEPTLLIDIGSTTTDILHLEHNKVQTRSRTDLDRLCSGELVYTGIERSNVAGILTKFIHEGVEYPIVNELFATAGDVHRVLGNVECDEHQFDTADGKAQSLHASRQRLARTLGTDAECINDMTLEALASTIAMAQRSRIAEAIQQRLQSCSSICQRVILSGHGDFLAKAALQEAGWSGDIRSLADEIGIETSRAACAFAVASLLENA